LLISAIIVIHTSVYPILCEAECHFICPDSEAHQKMAGRRIKLMTRLGRGKTITIAPRALYGQHSLADSSINYTVVAYQTCGACMWYQHLAIRAPHSCKCTAVQHDGTTGHLCA